MEALTSIVDYLAAPPRFFALTLVLYLACRGSRLPWSRNAGWVFALGATAFLGVGLSQEVSRRLILHPERLPVVLLLLSSLGLLWFEMRRFLRTDREFLGDKSLKSFSSQDAALATGVGVILAVLVFFLPPGLGPEANPAAKPEGIKVPWFLVGLQELTSYFDPWVPYLALPLLLVGGLLALPFLETGDNGAGRRRALFLLGWFFLWLWPMTVGALLRGPQWNALGPFEAWDAARAAPLAARPLSEIFWIDWLRSFLPASWWLRELPGIVLLITYFVLLPLLLRRWALTRDAVESYRKAMGTWPFRAAMAWVLAVMVVPLKMYGQWLWDIGYWLHLPELSFNF